MTLETSLLEQDLVDTIISEPVGELQDAFTSAVTVGSTTENQHSDAVICTVMDDGNYDVVLDNGDKCVELIMENFIVPTINLNLLSQMVIVQYLFTFLEMRTTTCLCEQKY